MQLPTPTLEGNHVRLEPISRRHRAGLCEAIADGELWKLFVTLVPHPDAVDEFLDNADVEHRRGEGLNRVEFLTDFLNRTSRNAILRLGANEEGLLRNHMVMPNGRIRDSVLYSVIRSEWPGVKEHLSAKLT